MFEDIKPLNWTPGPAIGYTVIRRPDGGMHFTFTNTTHETVMHWRAFALQHLYDSDRLTRNLYDLSRVEKISEEAIRVANEVNSDPNVRNIRLAIVVASEAVREAILEVAVLPGGVEAKIFTSLADAEAWLSRPLEKIV